jgi:hypothetical protein
MRTSRARAQRAWRSSGDSSGSSSGACGPSEPAPRSSIVYWKRNRVFVGAFIERGRLELNIDLFREAEHPCLLAAFKTTKRVVTHRLRITEEAELDDAIATLVAEAYEDVGPGTRGR